MTVSINEEFLNTAFPQEGWRELITFFFGLLKVYIVIEDRRPDLTSQEASVAPGYKYKTSIYLKCFKWSFQLIVRSCDKPRFSTSGYKDEPFDRY